MGERLVEMTSNVRKFGNCNFTTHDVFRGARAITLAHHNSPGLRLSDALFQACNNGDVRVVKFWLARNLTGLCAYQNLAIREASKQGQTNKKHN